MNEVWKKIEQNDVWVSDLGRIKIGTKLQKFTEIKGELYVLNIPVATFVAIAFLDYKMVEPKEIIHINGILKDNRKNNIKIL